jgi:hypothetical protein
VNLSKLRAIVLVATFTLFMNLFVPQAISTPKGCTPSMTTTQITKHVATNLKPKGQINECKYVSIRLYWDPRFIEMQKVNPISIATKDVGQLAKLGKKPIDNQTFITLGDLNGLHFQGSTLVKADLMGVNLARSSFALAQGSPPPGNIGLRIIRSNLNDADFSSSTMNSVLISESSVLRANFQKSKFKGAKLTKSDFSGANFNRADFSGADFSGSIGCGIKGKPSKLPTGVKIVGGCLNVK